MPLQTNETKKPSTKKKVALAALAMISATLVNEGGYVFNKADPGGETNYGITKKVAEANHYYGPMKTLPLDVAKSVYYKRYIVAPGYLGMIQYNAPIIAEVYDTAVNMGDYRATKFLQISMNSVCKTNMKITGKVTQGSPDSTVEMFANCSQGMGPTNFCLQMLDALDRNQKQEYDRLSRVNHKLKIFYRGWINYRIGNVPRSNCKVEL
jgi:hypothetical protein